MAATTTVVLGAGFGGIATARALRAALPREHRIIVVDQRERFSVGAGLTWVMLGKARAEDISRPIDALAKEGIEVRHTAVTAIHPTNRRVETSSGTLEADHLVIALGAETHLEGIPGLSTAETFYTLDGAEKLRARLESFDGKRIVVLI